MYKRNYGIDLLKLISMLMVALLHVVGQGGVIGGTDPTSLQYQIACFLQIAAYCAVNCYALISGYVNVDVKFKYHRILTLWLQVVFYTLLLTYLMRFLYPEQITWITWVHAIRPVTSMQYWYFTAYFGMFLFIPFFNKLLNVLNDTELKSLGITIIITFSVVQTLSREEIFFTQGGYCALWLALLYLLGGIIKKLNLSSKYKGGKMLLVYLVCIVTTWAFKFWFEHHPSQFVSPQLLVNYTSFTIVFSGIALLLWAVSLDIRNKLVIACIKFLAPLSFSVYIIHVNPLVWNNIMSQRYVSYGNYSPIKLIFSILGATLVIYSFCSLVDLVRHYLFKYLKIALLCKKLEKKVVCAEN